MGGGMETNKFLQPGEQRAARVEDLFAIIASRYDLINDLQSLGLHRRWKHTLVQNGVRTTRPARLGSLLRHGRCGLRVARERGRSYCAGFQPRDAGRGAGAREKTAALFTPLTRPIPAGRCPANSLFLTPLFDVVTVAYGLRNLSSWERGLEEMARVAQSRQGRLLVLDFGKPDNAVSGVGVFLLSKIFRPCLRKIFLQGRRDPRLLSTPPPRIPPSAASPKKCGRCIAAMSRCGIWIGGAMSINYGVK